MPVGLNASPDDNLTEESAEEVGEVCCAEVLASEVVVFCTSELAEKAGCCAEELPSEAVGFCTLAEEAEGRSGDSVAEAGGGDFHLQVRRRKRVRK